LIVSICTKSIACRLKIISNFFKKHLSEGEKRLSSRLLSGSGVLGSEGLVLEKERIERFFKKGVAGEKGSGEDGWR